MHWQRLDRETSVKVIDSVKSDANAGLFSIGTSEVQRARLPFYKDYFVYKVTNFASLPSFSFEYLGDGTFFQYLDGTEAPIIAVNDKGQLNLDHNNVLAYLEFYFAHAIGEDGDIILINNPHDMPLLESLDIDSYNAVFAQHKPVQIHYDGGYDAYEIDADLYKDSQVVRARIEVNSKGRVTIKDQKMTMQQVSGSGYPEAII
ncbi:MAG TPA: hypothetical protein PLF01_05180 [Alphaproteobacteria bacterium]|nr:hypothetical protein [Alphaproteobacteria bacterium]